MPLIIIPSTPTVATEGILRPLFRRALGVQYGRFGTFTTTGVAAGGEANRQVVCSTLTDDFDRPDRLKGRYLYVATGDDAGTQTRIRDAGYHGAIGYLEVSVPFATPLASGVEFEISMHPCEQDLDTPGLNQFVNQGLARCLIESRITLTGNGTRSYSLLAYEGYLDMEQRIDAIYDNWAVPTGDPNELAPSPVRIDTTNGAQTLVTGYAYAADQTFDVRVLQAGHTLINDGTGWATSTVGLTSDTQAAAVPIPWVVAFGMVKLLQMQSEMVEQDEEISEPARVRRLNTLAGRRKQWAGTAMMIQRTQFPRPTPPFRDAMVSIDIVSPGALTGLP